MKLAKNVNKLEKNLQDIQFKIASQEFLINLKKIMKQ